jgi:hypothetical protein
MSALLLAMACGVCLEDKVAATYDYALVQRALAQQRVVVFASHAHPWTSAAWRLSPPRRAAPPASMPPR